MTVSSTSSPTRALSKTERPDDRRPIPENQHMFVHHQAAAWPLLLAVLLPLTVAGCLTADGAGLADAVGIGSSHHTAINSERFKVDAVDLSAIDPRLCIKSSIIGRQSRGRPSWSMRTITRPSTRAGPPDCQIELYSGLS